MEFLKFEWKTIVFFSLFLGSIFVVYYHLEYRPAKVVKPIETTCIKPGQSLAGIKLGQSLEEIQDIISEHPSQRERNILGVERMYFEKNGVYANFREGKLVSVEFYPTPAHPLAISCEKDAEVLGASASLEASPQSYAEYKIYPYNGWTRVESIKDDDTKKTIAYIVLATYQ
ncbi:MAG: hypothetical protein WC966_09230 [Bradymonadales bacterium]